MTQKLDPIKNEDHLISHHEETCLILHKFLFQPRSATTLPGHPKITPTYSSLCDVKVGLDRRRRLGIDTLRRSDHPENRKGKRR